MFFLLIAVFLINSSFAQDEPVVNLYENPFTREKVVPSNWTDFKSFEDKYWAQLDDTMLRRDELMISMSRYLGNLYGFRSTDFTTDEYIQNDLKQAVKEHIEFRNTDEYDMLIKATNDYIRKGVEYLTSFLDTTFSKSNLMDHFESEEKTFKKHIEELKDQALFDLIDATFDIPDKEDAGNKRRCVIFGLLDAYYNATTIFTVESYNAFDSLFNSISSIKHLITHSIDLIEGAKNIMTTHNCRQFDKLNCTVDCIEHEFNELKHKSGKLRNIIEAKLDAVSEEIIRVKHSFRDKRILATRGLCDNVNDMHEGATLLCEQLEESNEILQLASQS